MNLIPFKPIVYRRDLRDVTSPPVDIVSADHEAVLKQSPYNITHITSPLGGNPDNATVTLREWIRNGIMYEFPEECVIALIQEIPFQGGISIRAGIIAPVETSPPDGQILPHEDTFEWAVSDRRELMRRTGCQLEPIFLIVNGSSFERIVRATVKNRSPDMEFSEPAGVTNKAFFITDRKVIENLTSALSRDIAVVADGHHRLGAVRQLSGQTEASNQFWKYSLAFVTSLQSDSLFIGGIHRVISREYILQSYIDDIRKFFSVQDEPEDRHPHLITLYDGSFHTLSPLPEAFRAIGCDRKYHYNADPSLVSDLVLRQIVNMTTKELSSKVLYTHSRHLAIEEVDRGQSSFSFLMPEWEKSVFLSMLQDGRVFPQKSTYFYPKVPSGVSLMCAGDGVHAETGQ